MNKVALASSVKDAYAPVLGERVATLEGVLTHPDPDDPFWAGTDLTAVADTLQIPTALISGWYDVCLDQTLRQYSRLSRSGAPTSLLVGPWTHTSAFDKGLGDVFAETLAWLNAHLRDDKSGLRPTEVRLWAGDGWRDLTGWPPAQGARWHVRADGTLGDAAAHEPIPLRQDSADLFARLCVVDAEGRSVNLCDGLLRLDPSPAGPVDVTVPMSATAPVIHPGERIRLQLSGAPIPRFARRPGGPSVVSVHRAALVLGQSV